MKTKIKKTILSLLAFGFLLTILIVACRKNPTSQATQATQVQQPSDFSLKTDEQKIAIMNADADWQYIAKKNLETMSKLVNSNIDVDNFDFTNEELFLNAIGKNRQEYLNDVKEVKAAAKRLIAKYNLSTESTGECVSCNYNNDAISRMKNTIKLLRGNANEQSKFESLLQSNKLKSNGSISVNTATLCCGAKFYGCCAIAAATIEVFPVYLAACYFCFDSYCCKP